MNKLRPVLLPLLTIAFLSLRGFAQDTPYMDSKLSPEERAADLVHRMTLEEKACNW